MIQLITEVVKILGKISDSILNWWLIKKSKEDVVANNIKKNDVIYNKLTELLSKTNCDRVFIFQFHNGGSFYTGQPIQKCSCTYEVVGQGISSANKELRNVFISNYHAFLLDVVLHGAVYYTHLGCVKDNILKDFLHKNGVKSELCWAIRDLNGNIIGFIGCHYVKDEIKSVNPEVEALFIECASSISGYLYNEIYMPDQKAKILNSASCLFRNILMFFVGVVLFLVIFERSFHIIKELLDFILKFS